MLLLLFFLIKGQSLYRNDRVSASFKEQLKKVNNAEINSHFVAGNDHPIYFSL
jgi:hypothetical protein